MKYETFEDLYRDNAAMIECEFKGRFFEMFNKILAKIEWYQEKEHDHIDGGNCSSENDYYRKNTGRSAARGMHLVYAAPLQEQQKQVLIEGDNQCTLVEN